MVPKRLPYVGEPVQLHVLSPFNERGIFVGSRIHTVYPATVHSSNQEGVALLAVHYLRGGAQESQMSVNISYGKPATPVRDYETYVFWTYLGDTVNEEELIAEFEQRPRSEQLL